MKSKAERVDKLVNQLEKLKRDYPDTMLAVQGYNYNNLFYIEDLSIGLDENGKLVIRIP